MMKRIRVLALLSVLGLSGLVGCNTSNLDVMQPLPTPTSGIFVDPTPNLPQATIPATTQTPLGATANTALSTTLAATATTTTSETAPTVTTVETITSFGTIEANQGGTAAAGTTPGATSVTAATTAASAVAGVSTSAATVQAIALDVPNVDAKLLGCPATIPPAEPITTTVTGPGSQVTEAPPTEAQAEPLFLIGTMYTEDCRPLEGAQLLVWHTNADGAYGPPPRQCCYHQAVLHTDEQGRYALMTIKPGRRKDKTPVPPLHMEMNVRHPDIGLVKLNLLFAEEPFAPGDSKIDGIVITALTNETGANGPYLRGVYDVAVKSQ
jgi:hypothetical protein